MHLRNANTSNRQRQLLLLHFLRNFSRWAKVASNLLHWFWINKLGVCIFARHSFVVVAVVFVVDVIIQSNFGGLFGASNHHVKALWKKKYIYIQRPNMTITWDYCITWFAQHLFHSCRLIIQHIACRSFVCLSTTWKKKYKIEVD